MNAEVLAGFGSFPLSLFDSIFFHLFPNSLTA
jgi:hypothetical protein